MDLPHTFTRTEFPEPGIARILLARPRVYNALSLDLLAELTQIITALGAQTSVKVIIIEGEGKGFSAGHDLKEILHEHSTEDHERLFTLCSDLMLKMADIPQVIITKVHGIATAAGCQIVAAADLAYASDDARFGTPGVNIGLFCSTPMVPLTRVVSPRHAMEMLLTGELISAEKAARIGLINGAVPEASLGEHVMKTARLIASKSRLALGTGKAAFYRQLNLSTRDAYVYCTGIMVESLKTHDAREGIGAFLEKRTPSWLDR
ncbi:enoyl-CoA hydratase [Myxococcota bacterium]|nr:enoyl-CoA hydratase [Myxococcota bacterium]MBU1533811.1 enoyl-CoA hydratase [Myxococcota bacterium]